MNIEPKPESVSQVFMTVVPSPFCWKLNQCSPVTMFPLPTHATLFAVPSRTSQSNAMRRGRSSSIRKWLPFCHGSPRVHLLQATLGFHHAHCSSFWNTFQMCSGRHLAVASYSSLMLMKDSNPPKVILEL